MNEKNRVNPIKDYIDSYIINKICPLVKLIILRKDSSHFYNELQSIKVIHELSKLFINKRFFYINGERSDIFFKRFFYKNAFDLYKDETTASNQLIANAILKEIGHYSFLTILKENFNKNFFQCIGLYEFCETHIFSFEYNRWYEYDLKNRRKFATEILKILFNQKDESLLFYRFHYGSDYTTILFLFSYYTNMDTTYSLKMKSFIIKLIKRNFPEYNFILGGRIELDNSIAHRFDSMSTSDLILKDL